MIQHLPDDLPFLHLAGMVFIVGTVAAMVWAVALVVLA